MCDALDETAAVVAVCLSSGGIPKIPQDEVHVVEAGIVGDGHDHTKHNKPTRALSLLDEELLLDLIEEGYDLVPGSIGENVLLRGVRAQQMPPGTPLRLGDAVIRLEEPRKPCFVLDAIDPKLKDVIAGRCGYMASVVRSGGIRPGDAVTLVKEREVPLESTGAVPGRAGAGGRFAPGPGDRGHGTNPGRFYVFRR